MMSRAVEVLVWWVFLLLAWLASLSSYTGWELIVGVLAAVIAALLVPIARRAYGGSWSVPVAWWARSFAVVRRVLRDLLLICTTAPWAWREHTVPIARDRPAGADTARRNAAAAFTELSVALSPGTVVVGVDEHADAVLAHSISPGHPR